MESLKNERFGINRKTQRNVGFFILLPFQKLKWLPR
jgi:hypothetical protein